MNINSRTSRGMFEANDSYTPSVCDVCRWNHSEMCPRDITFIGRAMIDLANLDFTYGCHRFCLTSKERERRWKIVMDKMHENIEIE